ncbi:MAG: hypothetical protein ABI140_03020 [Jatrophihabitantaceae bacterium]
MVMFGAGTIFFVLVALIPIGILRLASYGRRSLRNTPAAAQQAGLVEPATSALEQRIARLRRYRWRGGLLGVSLVAVLLLAVQHTLTFNLEALLVGVAGGALLAEWQAGRLDRAPIRTARLSRRTLSAQAGTPLLLILLAGSTLYLTATVLYGVRVAVHGRDEGASFNSTGCHELLSRPGVLLDAALAIAVPGALLAAGLLVALAATRRPDDPDLPGRLDQELRRATVRFGLGAPAMLAWSGAAVALPRLIDEYLGSCASLPTGRSLLILLPLSCWLVALGCLANYLLRPVQVDALGQPAPVG